MEIEDEQRYKKLIETAKKYSAEGKLIEAIHSFEKANKIHFTEKTSKRIKILQDALEDSDVDENFIKLKSGLILYKNFAERLYPHQIEGVNWLYTLHRTGAKGGLLADDMGLGKTIQIIAFLSALFDMKAIKSVLLVLPLSLIENWSKEFKKWAPGISLRYFRGSKAERIQHLKYVQRHSGVLMTTYGLIVTQWEMLSVNSHGHDFVWDYTILDEGHRIKNPTKTTKGIHAIPSRFRVILTGTPVQNNLKELWSLIDWTMQGSLLGRRKTFQMEFETPIVASRKKGASASEIAYGLRIAENLRKIIDPYMLRRTKASVQKVKRELYGENQGPSFPKLKKKTDLVIWTYISKTQAEIYKAFVEQESVKQLLMTKRSPLVELVQMKKICDHPRLLSRRCCNELGLQANDSLNESRMQSSLNDECAANKIDNITDETLISESGKLKFLMELLNGLRAQGHRALVFSRSKKILNMVERILRNRKFKVIRLDGSVTKTEERNRRVQAFQTDDSYHVFLLTVQVGGVGLTLTSADRAIIYDPSWNPADDAQAIDRIYRIGQQKNVVVYRLITCGTLEEKIFRRQVFKNSIIKQANGEISDPYRYFTNHELRDLFVLDDPKHSATQVQLQELHGKQSLDKTAEDHVNYLHTLDMFGVSYHELMFSAKADDYDEDEQQQYHDELNTRVKAAQTRLQDEVIFAGQEDENKEMRWGGSLDRNTRPTKTTTSPMEDLTNQINEINVMDEKSPINNFFPKQAPSDVINLDDDHFGDNIRSVPPVIPVPPVIQNNASNTLIDLLTDSDSESDNNMNSNFIDNETQESDISSEDELLEDLINKSIVLPNQRRNELLEDQDSFEEEEENASHVLKNSFVIDETLDDSAAQGGLNETNTSALNLQKTSEVPSADVSLSWSVVARSVENAVANIKQTTDDVSTVKDKSNPEDGNKAAGDATKLLDLDYTAIFEVSNSKDLSHGSRKNHDSANSTKSSKSSDIVEIVAESIKGNHGDASLANVPAVYNEDEIQDDASDASTNVSENNSDNDSTNLNEESKNEEYVSLTDRVRSSMSESMNSTKNLSFESDEMSKDQSSIQFPNESDCEPSFVVTKQKKKKSDFVIPDSDESDVDESLSLPKLASSDTNLQKQMSSTPNAVNKRESSMAFNFTNKSLNETEASEVSMNDSTTHSELKLSWSSDEDESMLKED